MDAIEEGYQFLKSIKAVDTRQEFCKDWLNRSECYFRYLRHQKRNHSLSLMILFSHKINHYAQILKRQNDATKQGIGTKLLKLHEECERCIYERCASDWRIEKGSTA